MKPSWPARLAVLAFGALSLTGAWIIVLGGGFYHSPGKRAVNALFITGVPAVAMALLQGIAAAVAFTWLLRLWMKEPAASVLAFAVVFLPLLVCQL